MLKITGCLSPLILQISEWELVLNLCFMLGDADAAWMVVVFIFGSSDLCFESEKLAANLANILQRGDGIWNYSWR